MGKRKSSLMEEVDISLFEYEPKEITDEEAFQDYFESGLAPDDPYIPDSERAAYAAWLKKRDPSN